MLEKIPVYGLPFAEKEKLEFKIYRLQGSVIQRNDFPYKTELPHAHNYYEMCFFTGGCGILEIDFISHPIVAPSVHFLQPGQVHLIKRGQDYKGYPGYFFGRFF